MDKDSGAKVGEHSLAGAVGKLGKDHKDGGKATVNKGSGKTLGYGKGEQGKKQEVPPTPMRRT
jgi:hypothetical protein